MPKSDEIRFKSDELYSGTTGTVDHQNAIIRGVSVITSGLTAEGHNLQVDNVLIDQIQASAKERGKVPVTLDHGSGIKDLNGYLTGFRKDGDKLRADWHLLKSHDETGKILERAEVMPNCWGLSTAFKPPSGNMQGEPLGGGKFAARCEKLMSVDAVCRPAANPGGLFSVPEKVDNIEMGMAKEKSGEEPKPEPEPTMADVLAVLNQISERLDTHENFLNEQFPANNEPSLQDLVDASDEQLAEVGLTRAEVDAAVQEVMAGLEAEGAAGEGTQPGTEGTPGPGDGELATAGASSGADFSPGGAGAMSNLSALQKRVIQLETRQKLTELQKKRDAEEIELKSIEQKVMILAQQRNEAIQFAEQLQAKNEALELAVRTGTRPVKAGVDNGMRMFSAGDNGEMHEFQVRVKQLTEGGKTEAEALRFAIKENPGLHASWLQTLKNKPATAA